MIDEGDPVDPFSYAEADNSISLCSNGKSPGIDGVTHENIKANWGEYSNDILCSNGKSPGIEGVTYENIKANWGEYSHDILRLFNIILMNRKPPNTWKHATIEHNPKKNFDRNDLSTLRERCRYCQPCTKSFHAVYATES